MRQLEFLSNYEEPENFGRIMMLYNNLGDQQIECKLPVDAVNRLMESYDNDRMSDDKSVVDADYAIFMLLYLGRIMLNKNIDIGWKK